MTFTIESSGKYVLHENMLSDIQQEILQMMADGKTDKGISEKLKIDEHKVVLYQDMLLKAFNVSDTDDLIAVALKKGIIN